MRIQRVWVVFLLRQRRFQYFMLAVRSTYHKNEGMGYHLKIADFSADEK